MRPTRHARPLGLAALALVFAAGPVRAAVYTVNSGANSGAGTLNAAIAAANANAGADTINIAIGSGVRTIALTSALPAITGPVLIDATTQPGYAGTPLVQLDGVGTPAGTNGFNVAAGGVEIRGFSIRRFSGRGIDIVGNGNVVTGCWIGLDAAGNASGNGTGVFVTGSGNVVQTSTISSNTVDGVRIDGSASDGNAVRSNRIGTDPGGTGARANALNGVVVTGARNTLIGGDAPNGNIISGNGRNGVALSAGATGTLLVRNYLGVAADGATALGNAWNGVLIVDSPANTIGGSAAGQFNVISANGLSGVEIRGATSTGNIVQRGLIGVDLSGTQDVGNGQHGVWLRAPQSSIGTGALGAGGNVISGNTGDGIRLSEGTPTANSIYGNFIGTNAAGTAAIPNAVGVRLLDGASNNRVGLSGIGNVISGNTGSGVLIDALSTVESNQVLANYIGTNAAGTGALGNGEDGVSIRPYAISTRIGGAGTAGNVVAANARHGIAVATFATFNGTIVENNRVGLGVDGSALGNGQVGIRVEDSRDVTLRTNRVYANGALGIDIAASGATGNDAGDGDYGDQNFPILTGASEAGGTTTVTGTLDSMPSTAYRIELFASPACDSSAHGEGASYVTATNVTTNGLGAATFSVDVTGWAVGTQFTATATSSGQSTETSEFSPCAASATAPARIQFAQASATYQETDGTLTVQLSRTTNTAIAASVRVDSVDQTAVGGSDFQTVGQTVSFAPGQLFADVALTLLDDDVFEGNETFALVLSQPSAGAALGATSTHAATLTSNDAPPALSVDACSVAEGDAGAASCNFIVRLSRPAAVAVAFTTTTFASGAATENVDFTPQTNAAQTIPAGHTATTVGVAVLGDTLDEGPESFLFRATATANATGSADAAGTIVDDDPEPTISVDGGGCSVAEGSGGSRTCDFTVRLSAASAKQVTFSVATAAGTANGSDYQSLSTTRSFAPGQTTLVVPVTIGSDAMYEFDESYVLQLRDVANATPASVDATGTIVNDDAAPDFSVQPCSVTEGNAGNARCNMHVVLAAGAERPVQVYYHTRSEQNLLGTDASAESPRIPSASVFVSAGQSFGGWLVESGNVDHKTHTVMQPAHDRQLIDLHGNMPSVIGHDVATVPGQAYTVSFAFAGHPLCATLVSTIDVYFGDQLIGGFLFDATGNSVGNMNWRYETRVVYAAAATTRLRFVSTTPGSCGPHVDDVSVVPAGGASSGVDLVPTFAIDDAPATIAAGSLDLPIGVDVKGDTLFEGNESFVLAICVRDGACRLVPATIVDDDPPPSNTIFGNGFE